MNTIAIPMPTEEIAQLCRRWKVRELSLFGSLSRADFGPASDVDLLVSFHDDADWSLWEHIQMQQELEGLFGRDVDLISKRALEQHPNWMRRHTILQAALVLFSDRESNSAPG